MTKWCLYIIILLCIIQLALSFKLPFVCDSDTQTQICNSPKCILKASELLNHVNASVDPCDNLYDFACGGYEAKTELPNTHGHVINSFHPVTMELLERSRRLLEEEESEMEWESDVKAKTMYQSCMDTKQRDAIGSTPLTTALTSVLGGWPAVIGKDWNKEQEFNWQKSLIKLKQTGIHSSLLINVKVRQDLKDSKRRALYIGVPHFGVGREYLLKGDTKAYYEHMVDVTEYVSGQRNSTLEQEMKDVLNFEMELAKLTLKRSERRRILDIYIPHTIGDLPPLDEFHIPWLMFIKNMTLGALDDEINDETAIVVTETRLMNSLNYLLRRTPSRVIANYMAFHMSVNVLRYLDSEAGRIRFKYKQARKGLKEPIAQWKTCVHISGFSTAVSSPLQVAAASMYARKYLPPHEREEILFMVKHIKGSFKDGLESSDWMSRSSNVKALAKLEVMKEHIGYPDEVLNQTIITGQLEDYVVNTNDFFGNVFNLHKLQERNEDSLLNKPIDPEHWLSFTSVAVVNAFASLTSNSIKFPAGILQGIFFDEELPHYVNFASIGSIIGHEMTHNFDSKGKQFDEEGNLDNWWSRSTEQEYTKRAHCFIKQYSRYTEPQVGLKVNGFATQAENIADNVGFMMAYRGYDSWVSTNSAEPILPGLSLNQRQLFWLNLGNLWCSKSNDETMRNMVSSNNHSPARFRINGALSNIEEFAKDFNCPVGSNMNPKRKCGIW